MIRKFASILLALAMVLCFASCDNNANGADDTLYETVTNQTATANVYLTFVQVDGETGEETPLIANSAFEVTANSPSDLTVLYVFINFMASHEFLFTLNDNATGITSALNIDNTADKYWTCVVKQDGGQDIDLADLGNVFNITTVKNGDHLIFKYVDRPQ